ncbi:hypothetical protein COV18_04130 [Candidatus Woesearchaeota archaeon CG10_big_fil_rev_8_21_14_0_10_37_12]|nr:MAG: hypothetical protein COV18_04130 [Candidatus Woesearchaeota archaeon CG10_big_fil_rev_8_21_14_0_10_37_12]
MVLSIDAKLDEILAADPAVLRQRFEEDQAILKGQFSTDQEIVSARHVLEVLPGSSRGVINEASLQALRRDVKDGKLSGISLADLAEFNTAPAFSEVNPDKVSGAAIWDRGFLVVAYKSLGNKTLKTFYRFFEDDERRQKAASGQQFMSELTAYMHDTASDPELINILDKFRPVTPVYDKKNLIANQFINTIDLHEVFADASVDEKYKHLRATALFDVASAFYAKQFLASKQGRKWRRTFLSRDHDALLAEKVFARNGSSSVAKEIADVLGLNGEQSFSQGDGLPTNTMVGKTTYDETVARLLGSSVNHTYTHVDFEWACSDFAEATTVQRLVKSGLYDHDGAALLLSSGRSVESQLLDDISGLMSRIDCEFNEVEMRNHFASLKAEQYLLWAGRYKAWASSPTITKQGESILLSKYFYTLFRKELARQGKDLSGAVDSHLDTLFEGRLDDDQMRETFAAYHPEGRSFSVLKPDFPVLAEGKLKELLSDYRRRSRWNLAKKVGLGALATTLVAGATGGLVWYQKKVANLQDEVVKTEYYKEFNNRLRIVELYRSNKYGSNTTDAIEVKELQELVRHFEDKDTACAAYLDYESVYPVIYAKKSAAWKDIKDDVNWRIRDAISGGYIDSFVWLGERDSAFVETRRRRIKAEIRAVEDAHHEKLEAELRAKQISTEIAPGGYSTIIGDLNKAAKPSD